MRPRVKFLEDSLIEKIVAEARDLLCTVGLTVENAAATDLLLEHGARLTEGRVLLNAEMIDQALAAAPASFALYDSAGNQTHDLGGDRVHFTPGSAAIYFLDGQTGEMRRPTREDYTRYAKLVGRLQHLPAQSTAFIPADVPEIISDSVRLYLGLLHCAKPVVTGSFSIEGFAVMHRLLLAVRGSAEALRAKPLAIFTCAPTTPLSWSDLTAQNLLDCAAAGIPAEVVSMPLAGFTSPVTVVGTVIQHTAEVLSGVVLAQLAAPGHPVLFGGSPAPFDIRYETTPLGAVETMLLDCGINEVGKHLGLPTQAYATLSDAKAVDVQAGLETGMAATLAVLSGVNSVSGPGMLEFENCSSLEKLVVDNEIVGMALRLGRGVEPRDDFPAVERTRELLAEGHLLISDHSRRHLRSEHHFPGPVIQRASLARWREEGSVTVQQATRQQVQELLAAHEPPPHSASVLSDLNAVMREAATSAGLSDWPNEP